MDHSFSLFLDSVFEIFVNLFDFPLFQVFFLTSLLFLVFFSVFSVVCGRSDR